MADKKNNKADRFQELVQEFGKQLPDRLLQIQHQWTTLQERPDDELLQKEFSRKIHSLAGSAGTFGFHEIGLSANKLEQLLLEMTIESACSELNNIIKVDSALRQLEIYAINTPDMSPSNTTIIEENQIKCSFRARPLVYVLEEDNKLAQEIVYQLDNYGYEVKTWLSANEIIQAHRANRADAIILDKALLDKTSEYKNIAQQLKIIGNQMAPILFISFHDNWESRLEAIRAGGNAYFLKPLDYISLTDYIDQVAGIKIEEPYRVTVVDDTVLLAEYYGSVLQEAGMIVDIVNDPSALHKSIFDFGPDIIIMDLNMPYCSGIEAVEMIRQYPMYQGLPIVYLSTENTLEIQLNALKVGGDDFLKKPISDDHLVAAIKFRVKRFRELKTLMRSDSLTGLLNHISLKLDLEHELALAERRDGQLTFVMLDIDNFKSVNDRYGHPMGDRVIKSLARLITQRMRESDIVGRYGGEEFAVILPDTNTEDASEVIDALRKNFEAIYFSHELGDFSCTFSAGITSAPPANYDMETIIKLADHALYDAKHAGRNCIMLSESIEAPTQRFALVPLPRD